MFSEIEQADTKLNKTYSLHKSFNVWTNGWTKRAEASKKSQETIKQHHNEQTATFVGEVFQQEQFDGLRREWRPEGIVLCINTSIICEDLFDPAKALKMHNGLWVIDFSLSGIDAAGWTYGSSFTALDQAGQGSSVPHWNSYVRRRKWIHREHMDRDVVFQA